MRRGVVSFDEDRSHDQETQDLGVREKNEKEESPTSFEWRGSKKRISVQGTKIVVITQIPWKPDK